MDIKEALDTMNDARQGSPNRYNVEFVTYDKNRRTGGHLRRLEGCQTVGASHDQQAHGTISVLPEGSPHPVPVHVRLILKLNEQEVL